MESKRSIEKLKLKVLIYFDELMPVVSCVELTIMKNLEFKLEIID